jgi:phthalate 4,5-cis-dihydrodiol dehydrogenase
MLRFGIIGTGIIAHENYKALSIFETVKVTALCNRTLQKVQDFAVKYGLDCPVYTDYKEMVDKEKLDVVVINVPHDLHEEVFAYCADRKIDIIIEKPIANSYASAARILESARKNGIKTMVCHTQRYNAIYQTAKEYLKSLDLGKLVTVSDILHYNYFWEGRPQWFLEPERAGGGIVMNYGVHQLDRIHYLTDCTTTRIFGHLDWEKDCMLVDSSYQIMGIMDNGVAYSALCTGYTGPNTSITELTFTKSILRCSLQDNGIDTCGLWIGNNDHAFEPISVTLTNDKMFYRQFKDFIDYLEGRIEQTPISVDYAANMVRLIEAATESHNTGSIINI